MCKSWMKLSLERVKDVIGASNPHIFLQRLDQILLIIRPDICIAKASDSRVEVSPDDHYSGVPDFARLPENYS